MADITPFLGMTDDQLGTFQQTHGLDDATMAPILQARSSFAKAGVNPNNQTTPDAPLAYQAGQAMGQGVRNAAGQLVDAFLPGIRQVGPAIGKAAEFVGETVPNVVAGAFNKPVVKDPTQPGAEVSADSPTLTREEIMARMQQPGAQGQGGARPAGGAGGYGGGSSIAALNALDAKRNSATAQTQAAMADATKLQEQSISEQVRIAQDEGKARQELLNQRVAQEEDANARLASNEADRQKVVADSHAQIDQMKQEVRGMTVDPDHWYANADGSTNYGRRIGAALSVAMGQMGAALTGQRNSALDIINGAIDRDIHAQSEAIAGKRKDIDLAQSSLADRITEFGSREKGVLAEKSRMLEHFATQIEQVLASTSNEHAKANGMATLAAVRQEQAKSDNQLVQQNLAGAQQSIAARTQIQQAAASNAIQREHLDIQRAVATAKGTKGQIPGLVGTPVSEQAVNEASKVKGAMDGMRANLNQLRSMRDKYGVETFGPQKERYDALTKDLQTQYAVLKDMGAVSGSEQEKLDAVIHNPNTLFNAKEKMDTVDNIINNAGQTRLRSLGYTEQQENALAGANARPVQ